MAEFTDTSSMQSDKDLTLEELKTKYYHSIMDRIKADEAGIHNALPTSDYSIRIYQGKKENHDIYYGFCEDCNSLNKLKWRDGCADGRFCCAKLVCHDECAAYCSAGHVNYYLTFEDSITIECETCQELIKPHIRWWGISVEEHERRYG